MPVAKALMVATGMGLRGCPGPGFGRAGDWAAALLRDYHLLGAFVGWLVVVVWILGKA